MIIRPDNTLVIANITHKDLGQYTCLARNEAGEKSATASIYLPGEEREAFSHLKQSNPTLSVTYTIIIGNL